MTSEKGKAALGAGTLAIAAVVIAGCVHTGRIYVSTPQVNTRERLVAKRVEESEWLRRQLTNSDNITTTFQGVEDFREFSGFFAQVRASFNPAQGALSGAALDNQLLAEETEQWKLKKLNLDAKNEYLQALSSTNKTASTNSGSGAAGGSGGAQPSSNSAGSAPALPSAPTNSFSNRPEIPSPTNIVPTTAKAGLLDLLHDRIAYRNAVNSAIKSVELDDSHDLAGMMLYDLNFSVTIVPGDNAERLAQVKLSLKGTDSVDASRVAELRRFFSVWKDELQADLIREAADLQYQFRNRSLDQNDQRLLAWFLVRQLPALRSRLEQERQVLTDLQDAAPAWPALLKVLAQHRMFSVLTPKLVADKESVETRSNELLKRLSELDKMIGSLDDIQKDAAASHPRTLADWLTNAPVSTVSLDQPECILILKAIPWAVWNKYRDMLGRFVAIEAPLILFDPDNRAAGLKLGGLQINELAILSGHDPENTNAPSQVALAFKDDRTQVDRSSGISDTGELTFVIRLLERERQAYAATVEPKEYAQNISEVSARERMLNLIGAMQAAFPAAGVNAEAQMQYLRRRQELLHGIERRPLAAGFGMGNRDFGWVLGPKFDIEKGKKQFKHTTIRHDFSAAIVIPAWLNLLSLNGEFAWINCDGSLETATPLWSGQSSITRSVPLPRDAFRRITQALVANRPADEAFLFTSRPYPVVTEPSWNKQVTLGTNIGTFLLVIRGRELWRNPQVFLGTKEAQSVRVLSDMDGLAAEFAGLDTQVTSFNLKVVTTFGEYTVPSAVTRPVPKTQ